MKTLFSKITLLLCTLLLSVNFVWGKRMTGTVSIAQGKGTVQVEVWTFNLMSSDTKNAEAETSSSEQVTATYDKRATTKYCRFWVKSVATGYSFVAWYTNEACTNGEQRNESGKDYYDTNGELTSDKSYTYYAKFIPNPYTITLDNQSATTAGTASIAVTFDANTNLTSAITKPTRTGYTFKGYYTGKNGSGVQIINQNGNVVASAAGGGKTYTDASRNWKYAGNITLYAHWTANTYVVSFNSHGGTTKGNTTVTYDATYGASTNWPTDPTLTGYTFAGWWTAATSGEQVTASTVVKITSAQTLHAHWTANTYTIAYNANGGTGTTSSSSHTYDVAKALTTNGYSKTGYSFVGWATSKALADAGTKAYDDGQSVTNLSATQGATVTLYAIWTVNNYTITLNNQSATTAGTPSIAVTFDANTNLTTTITKPTKTGCTFEGYYTAVNGGGVQIINRDGNVIASVSGYTDASRNWKYANNIELYAYWKQNQTIQWTLPDGAGVEYTTGQEMGAVAYGDFSLAPSGLEIAYSTEPSSVATIVDGKLNVLIPNATVTVCANQGGSHDYNAATVTVCKTFTTAGCTPDGHSITATNITYGKTLASSTLSGTVTAGGVAVAGTLSWVEPTTAPNAGASQPFEVLFTPTNTSVYGSITFNVPVNVEKANPVITWNITNILHENVRYIHFVESSNKEAEVSYSTSNATLLNITDGVLTTGEVTSKQNGWIKVSQPETANYEAYNATWTLKHDVGVYPKNDKGACLPFLPMNQTDYNNAMVQITTPGEWCNTNANGRSNYVGNIDVIYSQAEGIALGIWSDGWDDLWAGIGAAAKYFFTHWTVEGFKFHYSDKEVVLSFSGIPETISFEVESQSVTSTLHSDLFNRDYNVTWPATAKNWSLYESADGVNFNTPIATFTSDDGGITRTLNENTRFIKIVYSGNFTGFVKNLRITRKQYIRSDKSSLLFGTDSPLNPLQEPQAITLSYSSLGVCGGSTEDAITVTSSNPAFYVDEETITENVGIEQKGSYTIRVRCNNVNQEGMLTCTSNDGTTLSIPVRSTNPPISTAATDIFQTGTEHNPVFGTAYRAQQTLMSEEAGILAGLFNGSTPLFDELYIYGVSESATDSREWEYSPAKGYKVPVVNASNVHTPCFVYKKDGTQYTYVRTFDAAKTTLNAADSKTRVLVGYRPEGPAATALQLGTGAVVNLNNTEIVSTGVAIHVNGDTATVAARGKNTVTSASNAAVQLSGATSLGVEDNWKSGEASAVLALRPAAGYPSIDLGSASGRVYINGTQLELHNAAHMAIAHMEGTTENFDGEVHITDGSIGGEEILGMPKLTFIDGGTFNDGTVNAYTLKGVAKRPRNSRGEIVSRQTMTKTALEAYDWYGQAHLTLDGSAKVNPMLMDEEIWIFNGTNSDHSDDATSWNKESVPGETADVLINAPMVVSGGELKVKSLTINWEDKGKGIPAVTVNPDGGLTVGEGGIDGIKVNMVNNLALKAGAEGATKGQTGFLRIHPNSAEPMPEATVELYSIGYYDYNDKAENIAKWQYVGSPLASSDVLAKTVYKKNWVYAWDEAANEWSNKRSTYTLTPFAGFATTQRTYADGMMLTYTGQIVSSETNINIPLSYSGKGHGENVLANSFVAPIDITKFEDEDFKNIDSTVYLFNTGSRTDEEAAKETKDINTPGQYLAIPIGTARLLKGTFGLPTVIAPMQGFCVHAIKEDAEIKLNYEKLVWNGNYVENANTPLRVKAYYSEEDSENVGALRISLKANGWMDHLFMIESEQFNTKYEGGYDARKRMGDELNIFAVENNDQLSVDATNSIIGTRVGVRTGEETMYTMFFSHLNSEKELALLDWETEQITEITENAEYTFFAEPNSMITDRFEIIEWDGSNKPGIATGVENVENGTKVHKFIKDNQLFILKNGVLYNATGVLVR